MTELALGTASRTVALTDAEFGIWATRNRDAVYHACNEYPALLAKAEALGLALGKAFEALTIISAAADEEQVAIVAKEAAAEIDASLTAYRGKV